MPSKLQKEAAKRLVKIAPPSAALDYAGPIKGHERQFKQFVGDSNSTTDTPRRKINNARALAQKAESEDFSEKARLARKR